MLIVWALLGAMWAYLVHVVYPGTALFVSKALGAVPMLRVVTAAISTIFWYLPVCNTVLVHRNGVFIIC